MGMYASVRGWLEVDHKQREAVEAVIAAAGDDLYSGGWGSRFARSTGICMSSTAVPPRMPCVLVLENGPTPALVADPLPGDEVLLILSVVKFRIHATERTIRQATGMIRASLTMIEQRLGHGMGLNELGELQRLPAELDTAIALWQAHWRVLGALLTETEMASIQPAQATAAQEQSTRWAATPAPCSRRARAASRPGSQHGDLRELLGRAVAVLGQPADVSQASQRPPRADEVRSTSVP